MIARLTDVPDPNSLPAHVISQADLSIKFGGLGLRGDPRYSQAAYIASVVATIESVRIILKKPAWTPHESFPDIVYNLQKTCSLADQSPFSEVQDVLAANLESPPAPNRKLQIWTI